MDRDKLQIQELERQLPRGYSISRIIFAAGEPISVISWTNRPAVMPVMHGTCPMLS